MGPWLSPSQLMSFATVCPAASEWPDCLPNHGRHSQWLDSWPERSRDAELWSLVGVVAAAVTIMAFQKCMLAWLRVQWVCIVKCYWYWSRPDCSFFFFVSFFFFFSFFFIMCAIALVSVSVPVSVSLSGEGERKGESNFKHVKGLNGLKERYLLWQT